MVVDYNNYWISLWTKVKNWILSSDFCKEFNLQYVEQTSLGIHYMQYVYNGNPKNIEAIGTNKWLRCIACKSDAGGE